MSAAQRGSSRDDSSGGSSSKGSWVSVTRYPSVGRVEADDPPPSFSGRGSGVGALVGLVVAGGGGRLAMRLIALADDREDFGLSTEGGDTVGEVTLEGTLFVLFTGLVLGTVGAFLYLALRRWLPGRPLLRSLSFALIILGFGLTATVNGNDADFEFVNTVVSILSFATVLLVYGMLVPTFIDRLAPHRPSLSRWGRGGCCPHRGQRGRRRGSREGRVRDRGRPAARRLSFVILQTPVTVIIGRVGPQH